MFQAYQEPRPLAISDLDLVAASLDDGHTDAIIRRNVFDWALQVNPSPFPRLHILSAGRRPHRRHPPQERLRSAPAGNSASFLGPPPPLFSISSVLDDGHILRRNVFDRALQVVWMFFQIWVLPFPSSPCPLHWTAATPQPSHPGRV